MECNSYPGIIFNGGLADEVHASVITSHMLLNVITYACPNLSWIMLVKGDPGRSLPTDSLYTGSSSDDSISNQSGVGCFIHPRHVTRLAEREGRWLVSKPWSKLWVVAVCEMRIWTLVRCVTWIRRARWPLLAALPIMYCSARERAHCKKYHIV